MRSLTSSLLCLFLGCWLPAPHGLAQSPVAKSWLEEWRESSGLKHLGSYGLLRSLVVVKGFQKNGTPRFHSLRSSDFGQVGLIAGMPASDSILTFQLNDWTVTQSDANSAVDNVFRLLNPDAILLLSGKNSDHWQLIRRLEDGERDTTAAASPGALTPTALLDWLQGVLGFDAAIVDVQENHALVLGVADQLTKGRQAIVIAGSDKAGSVDRKTAKVSAIVEIVDAAAEFAVVRLLVERHSDDEGALKPGAKILFSRLAGEDP